MSQTDRFSSATMQRATLLSFVYLATQALATGEPCNIANSKLDPNSHKFRSDCGPQDYCAVSLANTGSISTAIKRIPTDHDDDEEPGSTSPRASAIQRRSHRQHALQYHHQHSAFSPHKHETRLSRRGELQNIFLAAVADTYANDTTDAATYSDVGSATAQDIPMISEKDGGTTPPFGVNATGTCQPKGCRKDEFPFGYGQNDILPPRCPIGEFCPDEEDHCRPLLPLGGACQLNRDDQCQPAVNGSLWSNESNFNGSICLSYTCMYANKMEGEKCIIDNTIYSGFLPDGSQFTDIVSRDNCATGLYCTSDALLCAPRLSAGIPCKSDSQCLSGNCDLNNLCVDPPETPAPVPRYVYIVVPLFIVLGLMALIYSLWVYHQKARKKRNETLYEYWMEQLAYRRSILNMQLAAEKEQRRALLEKTDLSTERERSRGL